MAELLCTKSVPIREFHYEGYSQLPGKTITVWPPGSCLESVEARKETYRRLKKEFGLCVLHIQMSLEHYIAALEGGWDNSELQVQIGPRFMENLTPEWPPPWPKEHWPDDWERYLGAWDLVEDPSNPKELIPKWKLPQSHPDWVPHPPNILMLLHSGLLDYKTAVHYAFQTLLNSWGEVYARITGKSPTPFYSFYVDEPQRGMKAFSPESSFTFAELSSIYYYIKNQRSLGDPLFSSAGVIQTLFIISTYITDHPIRANLGARVYSELSDRSFFSSYDDYLWDLFGDDANDQSSEWADCDEIVPDASGFISLEEDWDDREFLRLLQAANSLKWDNIGVFGGSQEMPCAEFWHRLKRFCDDAVEANWMERRGYYTITHRTMYCHLPNCACDVNSSVGWSYHPPDTSSGATWPYSFFSIPSMTFPGDSAIE